MRGPHGEKAWCSESGVRRGLLHDVGKLVREQPPPSAGRRKITASVKNHILGHCVGKRVHGSRRPRRLCVGVHPHLIKVMTKVQLKKFAVFGSRGWPAERSTSWTIGRASPPPSVSPPRRESDARRSIVFSFWQSSHSPPAPPAPPQSHLRRNRGSTLIRENDHCRRIPPPFMTASATRSASCSNTSSGAPMRRALPLLLTGTATLAAGAVAPFLANIAKVMALLPPPPGAPDRRQTCARPMRQAQSPSVRAAAPASGSIAPRPRSRPARRTRATARLAGLRTPPFAGSGQNP